MADSRLVTWLVRDFLSASEQVTVPTLVISAASLVKSLLGALVDFSRTMEIQLLEWRASLETFYTYELLFL